MSSERSTGVHSDPLKSTGFLEAFWRRRETLDAVPAAFFARAGSRRLHMEKSWRRRAWLPPSLRTTRPRVGYGEIARARERAERVLAALPCGVRTPQHTESSRGPGATIPAPCRACS